ncbi:VRR-NUC domain-containing protein [Imhoffiella purpurea]|uniref:Uncharacterized protein n=1 Tax=Imhoffiella purpurea TaxID=1249627 RepID=W9V5D4_9GAMM|nr:VRR-NUC domain-containing protein [Imhoffiella purpurea]EXJ14758.1 hypothetical protein D779_2127 [Imhoffiella purpurea]
MSRRPFRLTPIEPLEHDIQGAILRYLAVDRRVAWAKRFNTGAHVVEGRDKQGKPKRRFIRYAFPGCADVLGQLASGHFLAIEVKRPGEQSSEEQAAFLSRVQEAGGLAILARSIDDVKRGLDAFFGEPGPSVQAMRETAISPPLRYPRGVRG